MDFRNILFPVDFSDRCAAAASWVKAMARLFDSSVFLLHILEKDASETSEARAHAIGKLTEMARTRFEGFTVTSVLRPGDPADEITAIAESRGIDLIMMPTHGTGRLRAALLGSVTAKVLNDSPCSVWTPAHHDSPGAADRLETDRPRSVGQLRSVLCAIDLSPQSRVLIRAADSLGARTGAKVRLVHAVAGDESEPLRGMDLEFDRYLRDCARVSAARLQQETGTAFDLCLHAGSPSAVVAAAARRHEADLVVVGRGKTLRNSYSIVRDSPCPVLSI